MPQWKVSVRAMVSDDACSSSAPTVDAYSAIAYAPAVNNSDSKPSSRYLSPGLVTEPMVDDEYSVGGSNTDGGYIAIEGGGGVAKKELLTSAVSDRGIVGSSDDVIVVTASSSDSDVTQTSDAVQLRIVTTHTGNGEEEAEAGGEADVISPPDSAVCDLLDHPYAGLQLQQLAAEAASSSVGAGAAVAAAGQLLATSTDDDDGYSSRSSIDSPGAPTPWRPDESHEADSAPSTITQSRLADTSAYLGSNDTVEVMDVQHQRRPLERRLSGSSEVHRPVQVVTPVISRRRATIDQAGSVSLVNVHDAASIAKQAKSSVKCDAVSSAMDCCEVAVTSVDVCMVTSSTVPHHPRRSSSSSGPATVRHPRLSGPCPLHPLVDHDYCTFAEFSADIQSSIIATTDNRLRTVERKYAAATAAGTGTDGGSAAAKSSASRLLEQRSPHRHKLLGAIGRRGGHRLLGRVSPLAGSYRTKRLASTGSYASNSSVSNTKALTLSTTYERSAAAGRRRSTSSSSSLLQTAAARARERYDSDPFVYFSRTAPLKPTARQIKKLQAAAAAEGGDTAGGLLTPVSAPVIGSSESNAGSSMFDWYQDLAKMKDKEREFCASEPQQVTDTSMPTVEDQVESFGLPPVSVASPPVVTSIASSMPCALERADTLKDSDVVNMVYEMMPKMEVSEVASSLPLSQTGLDSLPNVSLPQQPQPLLSDTSLSALFASVDVNALFPGGLGLSDLDDISVSDLLTSDYSSVASLLSDIVPVTIANLTSCGGDVNSASGLFASVPMAAGVDTCFSSPPPARVMPVAESTAAFAGAADSKQQLQQQIINNSNSTTAAASGKNMNSSGVSVAVPPELIVVSMHWNDLPGLQIGTQQYVRLVDIHRQVLPAKETAILKRRSQMLGHDVINCTDMQRDFLVRYANAAKSKSTWIVSREAADSLIGFYMDPRIRSEMEEAERQEAVVPSQQQQQQQQRTAAPLPPVRAPSVVLNNNGGVSTAPPMLGADPFSSQRAEVIHSSRPVKPRPGVPCVIVRDGPRVTQSHQQGVAGVPGRSVMSQMSCPGSVDTANHKMERQMRLGNSMTGLELQQQQQVALSSSYNEVQAHRQQLRRHHTSEGETPLSTTLKPQASASSAKMAATAAAATNEKQPLSICHKDSHRSGCRGRFQGGYLYLDLYVDRDAACVKCDICLDMLTLRHFAKHMHRQADPDQLVIVSFPQKFELYNFEPTTEEVSMWGEFERKMKRLDPATLALMMTKVGDGKPESSPGVATSGNTGTISAQSGKDSSVVMKPSVASPMSGEVNNGINSVNGLSKQAQQQTTITTTTTSPDAASAASGRHSERLKTRRSHLMDDYEYAAKRPNKRRMDA